MTLIESIIARAKSNKQRIVLPESLEERTLTAADMALAGGSRLLLLKDWMSSSPYICFDGADLDADANK